MATLKLLKLPKKPKANASAGVLERYIAKVNEIKKENIRRVGFNKKLEALRKKVAGIGAAYVTPNRFSAVSLPKKRTTAKPKRKSTVKRKTTKRR
jgi:hypothetical protein